MKISNINRRNILPHPADGDQAAPECPVHDEEDGGDQEDVQVTEVIFECETCEVVQVWQKILVISDQQSKQELNL